MQKYGPNQLDQPEPTPAFIRFLSQYNDPLNYLLITAALIALAIKPDHPGDAIFIFLVLTANAFWILARRSSRTSHGRSQADEHLKFCYT